MNDFRNPKLERLRAAKRRPSPFDPDPAREPVDWSTRRVERPTRLGDNTPKTSIFRGACASCGGRHAEDNGSGFIGSNWYCSTECRRV